MRPPLKLLATIAVVLAILFSLQPVQPATASSFKVNDNSDAGDAHPGDGKCATDAGKCTLRAAIDETNKLSGPNTILIPAMTIVLHSDLRINDDVGDDSVNIQGAGMDKTILDGNNQTRVFYFTARSGNHSISDLTIRNAVNQYQSSGTAERNGGGIFNEAGLTLTNVHVTGSSAFQGGGIYNQYAFGDSVPSLTLNSVILDHNSSTANEMGFGGGGLFNGSKLDGSNVTITDNTAVLQGGGYYNNSYQKATLDGFEISRNSAMDAAGIDNDLGDLTLLNGKINGNVTNCCDPGYNGTGGAGIFNNDGTMYLENVSVNGNVSNSPGGFGAGIYNFKFMTLKNVSITGNRAAYGAGIDNGWYEAGYQNLLTLISVTVSDNVGVSTSPIDAEGGGIHNRTYGTIYIYSSTITANSARVAGGISNGSTANQIVLHNSILAGNTDEYGVTDCRGTLTSSGYNIIGNPYGNPSVNPTFKCTFALKEGDRINANPMLGGLTGQPAYHPLLAGSPAIDAGTMSDCPGTDQRGYQRPMGNTCDIGSIEYPEQSATNYTNQIFVPMVER